MNDKSQADLGFQYTETRNNDVMIDHHGQLATILRGAKASAFISKMNQLDFGDQQQWMARITGNYKRGNERTAKSHPKNN